MCKFFSFIKKINFIFLFVISLIIESKEVHANPENDTPIIKITPPKLGDSHLGRRVLCHRPMRNGMPNMSVEKIKDKVVAHNYGHGGSGWTLGPGAAAYVNELLERSSYAEQLSKHTPITVIGAGALGLFTAYDLVKRGYTNITIIADRFEDLTSHNAGGLLAPVSMNNGVKNQAIIDEIGIKAYKFYKKIAKKKHRDFKKGALIVPAYFQNRQDSGLEPYVNRVMKPAKDVILDFGTGKTKKMVAYDDGIFIDTAQMIKALSDYIKHRVKFAKKQITDFSQIQDSFIINCTGLGSKDLNKDKELVSVQGHLILLKDQKPKNLQYMILVYFGEGQTVSGQKIKRSFYMFPKRLHGAGNGSIGVIGGTFIEGATSTTPNEREFETIIKSAREFYGLS